MAERKRYLDADDFNQGKSIGISTRRRVANQASKAFALLIVKWVAASGSLHSRRSD
jgi:hypothetical protein